MTSHLAARVTPAPRIMMGKSALKGTRLPVDLKIENLRADQTSR